MTGITSLRAGLAAIVDAQPTALAVVAAREDRRYSYAELATLLERFAPVVVRYGITPERPLLSVLPNGVEPFVAFLAMLWHGAGYAPLTPDATPRELHRWIETVTPAAALVGTTTPHALRDALVEHGIPLIETAGDGAFAWAPPNAGPAFPAPEHAGRLYLQTSGTTGEARALVFDGDRLWSSARAFLGVHPFVERGSCFLNNLPLSYLGGLFNLGLIPLAAGGSTVIAEAFSGKSFLDFWQTIERYGITVLWLVPTIVRGLLALAERTNRTLPAVRPRAAFIGTAPIDLATKRAFEATFGITLLENFALSETTFFTSERLGAADDRLEHSVGSVLPYAEVRFVPVAAAGEDEPSTTSAAPPTEILVRSPYFALGYRTHDGLVPLPLDADGFFATGDIGHLDEATRLLVIDGRRRDIIKKGGLFVALREVERVAEQYDDALEAAAVAVPHAFYGESLHLYVRLRAPELLEPFTTWLRANLVRYKWPEATYAVGDFPRTATGKIRKHLLTPPSTASLR